MIPPTARYIFVALLISSPVIAIILLLCCLEDSVDETELKEQYRARLRAQSDAAAAETLKKASKVSPDNKREKID